MSAYHPEMHERSPIRQQSRVNEISSRCPALHDM